MDYIQLLKKAKQNLPEVKSNTDRFETPKVKGHVEGNKTIISNFNQICGIFRRDPNMLLKYLQRELATPAVLNEAWLVFGRRLSSGLINKKIEEFVKDFVLCKECCKPDTYLYKEDRLLFMKCTACGAKQTIKSKV